MGLGRLEYLDVWMPAGPPSDVRQAVASQLRPYVALFYAVVAVFAALVDVLVYMLLPQLAQLTASAPTQQGVRPVALERSAFFIYLAVRLVNQRYTSTTPITATTISNPRRLLVRELLFWFSCGSVFSSFILWCVLNTILEVSP